LIVASLRPRAVKESRKLSIDSLEGVVSGFVRMVSNLVSQLTGGGSGVERHVQDLAQGFELFGSEPGQVDDDRAAVGPDHEADRLAHLLVGVHLVLFDRLGPGLSDVEDRFDPLHAGPGPTVRVHPAVAVLLVGRTGSPALSH
jgi:hypothetical protein